MSGLILALATSIEKITISKIYKDPVLHLELELMTDITSFIHAGTWESN